MQHHQLNLRHLQVMTIADAAISKHPLFFTVCTQLCLRSHQNFYQIFTHNQFLPTSAGNAQAQLHFRDDQQRAFGISNISNCVEVVNYFVTGYSKNTLNRPALVSDSQTL